MLTWMTKGLGIAALGVALAAPVRAANAQDPNQPKPGDGTTPTPTPPSGNGTTPTPTPPNGTTPNPGGDLGGRGGRQGRQGRGNRGGINVDELKTALSLSDDQVAKVTAIADEVRTEMQKVRDDMQNDPNADFSTMRTKMTEMTTAAYDKVRAILTDEQKPKFEDWIKQQEARRQQRGQGGQGGQGGRGRRDPEQMKKDLYDQAMKILALKPEEAAVVMPLVKDAIDARAAVRQDDDTRRQDFLAYMRTATAGTDAEKAAIAAKLAEYRSAREAGKAKLKDSEDKLRDVLTVENEAKLCALNILE
jgi:protein CpxP